MNEHQRQHYLQLLGIDSYCPRWLLPGAPPPRACALPLAEAEEQPPAEPAGGGTAEKAPLPIADLMSAEAPAAQAAPRPPSPAPASEAQDTAEAPVKPQPAPRFALTIWRVSAELMVIDSRDAQLALPTDQLLANIVAALGYRLAQLPKAEVLRWPLLENDAGNQGEAEAREMVQAFLEAQLARQAASHLLVMGEAAARFVLDNPGPFSEQLFSEQLGSAVALSKLAVTAVVTPSLATMLQDPSQKAVTWRAVQPLRQH